jgi:transcriptional regulator with XRE-family HTH domain
MISAKALIKVATSCIALLIKAKDFFPVNLGSPALKLKAWRKTNKLSQRQAAEVMASHDFPVLVETLQRWEGGFRSPGRLISKVLETFLRDHEIITDPPVYGRWKRPVSEEAVEEIRKLREGGIPLLTIAQRFGISESSVSRICSGNRRAK